MTVYELDDGWTYLAIRGEDQGPGRFRDDDGVCQSLMRWMNSQGIEWVAQSSGGGVFIGRVRTSDANRVAGWLNRHGATPAPCVTGEKE